MTSLRWLSQEEGRRARRYVRKFSCDDKALLGDDSYGSAENTYSERALRDRTRENSVVISEVTLANGSFVARLLDENLVIIQPPWLSWALHRF